MTQPSPLQWVGRKVLARSSSKSKRSMMNSPGYSYCVTFPLRKSDDCNNTSIASAGVAYVRVDFRCAADLRCCVGGLPVSDGNKSRSPYPTALQIDAAGQFCDRHFKSTVPSSLSRMSRLGCSSSWAGHRALHWRLPILVTSWRRESNLSAGRSNAKLIMTFRPASGCHANVAGAGLAHSSFLP